MKEKERMIKGLVYNTSDQEIQLEQMPYLDALWEFNKLKPSDIKNKNKYMKEVFAECGENNYIELPFHANWGGHHVHFGSNIYLNFNVTMVDDGQIYVGDNTMMGPGCIIATPGHPLNAELRKKNYQFNKDVHIGKNVWLGAGVIVLPGINIGDNVVIGAGSIVTKDIPSNSLAYGNPCRVIREINDYDKEYFYKKEKIDWDNLK